MATAEQILDIARGELGTTESPTGSNKTKYGAWYGLNGQPWCMIFIQWCFDRAGVKLPARTASCGALMRAAQAAGCWVTADFFPGDVVIYDFPGGAATDHTGIIEAVTLTGVTAIEGNTSQAGSQSNGGQVCRKTRPYSQIVGVVRPNYQKEDTRMDNTPSPAHREAVAWAQKQGLLTGDASGNLRLSEPVTRQQLCTLLYRFAKSVGKA